MTASDAASAAFIPLSHDAGTVAPETAARFRDVIRTYYAANLRPMPWRDTRDPYAVLVSEIMLQQTQVERVRLKYAEFMAAFPAAEVLAAAPLSDVLQLWQGLGYNRRAVFLKRCAEEVVTHHNGRFPETVEGLQALPGVGPYTARAVAAFSYGIAEPMIETNIRSVFIHFFFHGREQVSDSEIMPLVAATLDRDDPREWYYALMDYGVMLKQRHTNPGRRSRHHTRQSRFEGSNRQLRSRLLREVIGQPGADLQGLLTAVGGEREAVLRNLEALQKEGFLTEKESRYYVTGENKRG